MPLRAPLSRKPLGGLGGLKLLSVAVAGVVFLGSATASTLASPGAKRRQTLDEARTAYEARHPGVVRVGKGINPPKLVHQTHPKFDEKARHKVRDLSPIIAEAVITERGDILDPAILSSANPDLDIAVLEAMRGWRYSPAQQNGKPVAVFIIVTVTLDA